MEFCQNLKASTPDGLMDNNGNIITVLVPKINSEFLPHQRWADRPEEWPRCGAVPDVPTLPARLHGLHHGALHRGYPARQLSGRSGSVGQVEQSRLILGLRTANERRRYKVTTSDIGQSNADSRFAPSQWETALQSTDVSHWLGASLKSALTIIKIHLLI